jgi:hypothetical protein
VFFDAAIEAGGKGRKEREEGKQGRECCGWLKRSERDHSLQNIFFFSNQFYFCFDFSVWSLPSCSSSSLACVLLEDLMLHVLVLCLSPSSFTLSGPLSSSS